MKKVIILSLAAILASIFTDASGFTYTYKGKTLFYEITGENTCQVDYDSRAEKYSGDIEIPNEVNYAGVTYTVTAIRKFSFERCTELTSIVIPNSVVTIGANAFGLCSGLKEINLPESIVTIEGGAFTGCTGIKSVVMPNSVKTIGPSAFSSCDILEEIQIPESVESIGSRAFSTNPMLKEIKFPGKITTIEPETCMWCEALENVYLPSGITNIGNYAFQHCGAIKEFHVEMPDPSAVFVSYNAFASALTGESVLYVPDESYEVYLASDSWPKYFMNIRSAGVQAVTVDENSTECEFYNLQGVRVDNPSKGIFITKGRKILFK